MNPTRWAIAGALAAAAIVVGGASTSLAGYGLFQASYGGKTCTGYGATGAPPSYAYSATDATTASGLSLSECLRGIPLVEYCDQWGCFTRGPFYDTAYVYDSIAGAYSSQSNHVLAVPIGGGD